MSYMSDKAIIERRDEPEALMSEPICALLDRVYLICEAGTICISEWADGQITCRLLESGRTSNG